MGRALKAISMVPKPRSFLLVGISVFCCVVSAISQTSQVYQASIGAGVHAIYAVNSSDSCSVPSYGAGTSYLIWGTLTLRSALPLHKNADGSWRPASVTEFGPTSDGLGAGYQPGETGGSSYTSSISARGKVQTTEMGSDSGSGNSESVDSTETLDLNTGKYTWDRTITGTETGACGPYSFSATQHRTATLPVQLSPASPVTATLSLVNPALINGVSFPLPTSVLPADVANAPAASGLAADGASAVALLFQSSSADSVTFSLSAPGGATSGIGSLTPYTPGYLSNPALAVSLQTQPQRPINSDECNPTTGSSTGSPPCIFLALLWAPASISLNTTGGGVPAPLTLNVQALQSPAVGPPDGTFSNSILLMPPPLVLVHGIWSSAQAAWSPFLSWVPTNYPHQLISAADYERTSSLSFDDPGTQTALATQITSALASAADSGVAAQKVDVLAHSMGGLVTRYLMTDGPPSSFSGFLPTNPIHKLVTVGTPQNGSPFAIFLEHNKDNTLALGYSNPVVLTLCAATQKCTLGYFLGRQNKPIDSGVESLENGLQLYSQSYNSVVGEDTSVSGAEIGLNFALAAFAPGNTVDGINGILNDTIVPAANQAIGASDSAVLDGIVHTTIPYISSVPSIGLNDVGETASPEVWNQAVYWLLGEGTGTAPHSNSVRMTTEKFVKGKESTDDSSSSAPAPVLDLTGYTQVPASNLTLSLDPSLPLTIGAATTITATSSTKTLSEILLFQAVSDPADVPLYASTQSPFSISFMPIRLGTANFTAFAVFTDHTYATFPLSYTLQPSSSAVSLRLTPPVGNLPIGVTTVVPAQAGFSNGLVNVTSQATYAARRGGTGVFSVGLNGSITTTGYGYDWLDVSYGGQTASAMIAVGSCTFTLGPTNQIVPQSGGTATVQVTTQDGCLWTADAGGASWLTLSGASGSGSGSISVSAGANNTGSQQTAFITVAAEDVAIIQPASACSYTLGRTQIQSPASGTSGSIAVATSCPVIATSSQTWVAATALSSSINYFIAPNMSGSARSATITIGDQEVNVNQAGAVRTAPAVTVTPSSSAITTAQSLSVTVTVKGGSGNPPPTGSIALTSGSYSSPAATLSGGSATITIPAGSLAVGTDTLIVSYVPDSSSSSTYSSASGTTSVIVSAPVRTAPAVTVTPSSSAITTAQSLSVTVTVKGGSGNPTPTGSIALTSGSYSSPAATLSGGSATITIPAGSLAVGTDTLIVSYVPDSSSSSTYSSASGTTSVIVSAPVRTAPAVTVTPSSSAITTAQSLSVTVTVKGGSGNPTPTGSIALTSGSYSSPAATLSGGSATITIPAGSLAVGTDTLIVSYVPDSSSSSTYSSASGTTSVIVSAPVRTAPAVTVTPSSSAITTAQSLSVTVTVKGGSGNPPPTGSIALTSGSYSSPAATLSGGSATITIPAGSLAVGTDTLTVSYTADVASSSLYNNALGTASVTVTTATQPTYSMSATAVTVMPAASGTSTVTVSSTNGYTGTVTLTCSITSSPAGATDLPTCSAAQTVTLSSSAMSGTASVNVNTTAASSSSLKRPGIDREKGWGEAGGGAILAMVVFLGIPARRRRWQSMLSVLVLMAILGTLAACGGGGAGSGPTHPTNLGTTAGTYAITVTGTGNDPASTTKTTTFTLTVN